MIFNTFGSNKSVSCDNTWYKISGPRTLSHLHYYDDVEVDSAYPWVKNANIACLSDITKIESVSELNGIKLH